MRKSDLLRDWMPLQRERKICVRQHTGGLYWSEADWVSDCLIWFIDRAHLQLELECVQPHRYPQALEVDLTGRLLVVYSEDGAGRRLVRKPMSVWHPGDERGITKPLNLRLSLEDWRNFSDVHAPPTLCLLSQEFPCDWAWRGEGKVHACPGHKKHGNLSLCPELCSYFSLDTLDLQCGDLSHSFPHVSAHAYLLLLVTLSLKEQMFLFLLNNSIQTKRICSTSVLAGLTLFAFSWTCIRKETSLNSNSSNTLQLELQINTNCLPQVNTKWC